MVVNKDCESKVVQISFWDLFPYDTLDVSRYLKCKLYNVDVLIWRYTLQINSRVSSRKDFI